MISQYIDNIANIIIVKFYRVFRLESFRLGRMSSGAHKSPAVLTVRRQVIGESCYRVCNDSVEITLTPNGAECIFHGGSRGSSFAERAILNWEFNGQPGGSEPGFSRVRRHAPTGSVLSQNLLTRPLSGPWADIGRETN